ncbi:hypothetical protein [Vallitalea sp.]|jgi:hypothetical protein|uniref:hypothetical protein n=1 Tax=Vallitalea sp. TaxID=1882829 RepID=UPI0025FD21F5|nr:hypothetical protein [Vallitalea sp.]MCT4688507.1 hypothetical protein [Vallitalea sp.]
MANCDIRVQNLTLASGQPNPLPSGGPVNFKFQIANYSNVDSDGFNVTVKRDSEIGGGGTFYVSKVPAMTVINYPLEIHGVIGGTHEIEIEALYSDLDTSNNKVTGTFVWAGVPNLQTVITNSVPSTVELCQDTTINFRVNNFSYDHVNGTTNIRVFINDQPTSLGWTKENFQARTYIEQSFNANFKEPGVYKVSIVADSLTVTESNENDNIAEVTITVNDAPRLNNDDPTDPVLINQGDVHWYYAQFEEDGKANFYLEPDSTLDVDLEVFKNNPIGESIGKSNNGLGTPDLVKEKPVESGIKYYIRVSHYSGTGNYILKCKNYPTGNSGQILSSNKIEAYVNSNNLTSIQRNALYRVNTYINNEKIVEALSNNKPLIFFFEGAGLNTDTIYNKENGKSLYSIDRYGAIALVIKNNEIVFFTDQASTLPDKPKGTSYDIPTVVDGVYNVNSHLHQGKYPALKISSPKVIRFSDTTWYDSSSSGINIHAGYNMYKYKYITDGPENGWSNSEGCQLISMRDNVKNTSSVRCLCYTPSGTDTGIYHEFAKAINLVNSNIFSTTDGSVINTSMNSVSGVVVIDRKYLDTNNTTLQSIFGTDGLMYIRTGVE